MTKTEQLIVLVERLQRDVERLEADLRAQRVTLDGVLIARNTGPGVLALLDAEMDDEPSEEDKQAAEEHAALLKYLKGGSDG